MNELFSVIGSFVLALFIGALIGGLFAGGFHFLTRNNFHVEWMHIAIVFCAALIMSLLLTVVMLFGYRPDDLAAVALVYKGAMPDLEAVFIPTATGRILGCSVGFWFIWYRIKKQSL